MNQKYKETITVGGESIQIYSLKSLQKERGLSLEHLPFSIRILVENLLRHCDGQIVKETDVENIANWQKTYAEPVEIPYHPARVLMQDFTGVPAVVDLASMRDAVKKIGGPLDKINPLVPVDLIIDHSIQVDYYGTPDALDRNVEKEYQRNRERYTLLKWAQQSFQNFNVVPPNSGICHQVNLEYLANVVIKKQMDNEVAAFPDTLVGTDSHTTMINGIGVMGWGVGGIEAEAVMLGQPYYMTIPEVIGVKLEGKLNTGVTATDMVLHITELLRKHQVVEKFVEFFGSGMKNLDLTNRATIANMAPEYGATMGFFPIDEKTIEYLNLTNRSEQAILTESYTKAQGLFYSGEKDSEYTKVIDVDLSDVEPSIAGPARPQDRIPIAAMNKKAQSLGLDNKKEFTFSYQNEEVTLKDGDIVIAAITSCTNTSNPEVMIGAGLLAQKAVSKGLTVPKTVKTSLAPGSKVVIQYLKDSGVLGDLEALGFYNAGFGCTTCIGNSGPLDQEIEKVIHDKDLTVASVLSGNRNFEARIHQNIKQNYLASPLLVVAYALAGRIDVDFKQEPLGIGTEGQPVFLKDIWPQLTDIKELVSKHVQQKSFESEYDKIFEGDDSWKALPATQSLSYNWDENSTYIKNPPYFEDFELEPLPPTDITNARPLLLLGDSVTTDHISPAGAIPKAYPAGQYLIANQVQEADFNSYGSRRGNHEVMMRGTFANIRIKNKLVEPKEGGLTLKFPENEEGYVYDTACLYLHTQTPLITIGGKEYGTGSSRDWAAKGTTLLGVKAVIARSFERIHRSNLVGMGVLPLIFKEDVSWEDLHINGTETFELSGIADMHPRKIITVKAIKKDAKTIAFETVARLDTDVDVAYFTHGGILPYVLRKILSTP